MIQTLWSVHSPSVPWVFYRAEKIIDYLCDPLQKCLRDENPYVRKTAALCVAKLYDLKPELVIENGFLEQLHEMIADSNPMVRPLCSLHLVCLSQPTSQVVANNRCRLDGHSYSRFCATFDVFIRSWDLHNIRVYTQQTLDCLERMLRMGPGGNFERIGSI